MLAPDLFIGPADTKRDLIDQQLIKFLKEKTDFYKINPKKVTFEILENLTIGEFHVTIIKQLKLLKENKKGRTIIEGIVMLAKTLGVKTIAEFVEDVESYEILKDCGVDMIQGYYIGKPSHTI